MVKVTSTRNGGGHLPPRLALVESRAVLGDGRALQEDPSRGRSAGARLRGGKERGGKCPFSLS